LEDHRSPVISALLQTEKYISKGLPNHMSQFYDDENKMLNPVDIDLYQRD